MAVQCTGAEIRAFFLDQKFWCDEEGDEFTYYDDAEITVDGQPDDDLDHEKVPDGAIVRVDGGSVSGRVVGPERPTLAAYLRRWLKDQNTTRVVFEISKDKLDALLAAAKGVGAKVV